MKKLAAIAMCVLMLTGCTPNADKETTKDTAKDTTKATEMTKDTVKTTEDTTKQPEKLTVKPSKPDVSGMTVYKTAKVETSSHGSAVINVYTDAQKDKNGEFMWDDGHQFMLTAEIGGNTYELNVKEHVQLGSLEFMAFEDMGNKGFHVIVKNITGAGIKIKEYVLEEGKTEFTGSSIYDIANINGIVDSSSLN